MGDNEQTTMSLRDAIAQAMTNQAAEGAEPMPEGSDMSSADGMTAQGAAPDASVSGTIPAADPGMGAPAPDYTGAVPAAAPEPAQAAPADSTAQLMQMMMAQMRELQAQNAQLQQQVQVQQGAMQEQSQAAEGAMDAAMTQPQINIQMPDFSAWQYEDDETRERHMREWQESLVQSTRDATAAQLMAQFGPMMQEFEANRKAAENAAAKSRVYGDSRFSDFQGRDAQIEKILAADPVFSNMDADRRYLYGGLMARGLEYSPNPTAEQIVQMAKANPDALRMLDAERARTIADRNGQIPTIMPSSGMGTANAIPEDTPKNKDELHRKIVGMLTGR